VRAASRVPHARASPDRHALPYPTDTVAAIPPPPLALLALEPVRAFADWVHLRFASALPTVGDGHPVLVFAGLQGDSIVTRALCRALDAAGYASHDGQARVRWSRPDSTERLLGRLEDRLVRTHETGGRAVSLVGWSAGGLLARALALRAPELVRQVVTLGTALRGPRDTRPSCLQGDALQTQGWFEGSRADPTGTVPITSIYSRSDGVVAWQACLQPLGLRSENIDAGPVGHLGMPTSARVLRIVVERLAQPEGQWQRLTDTVPRGS